MNFLDNRDEDGGTLVVPYFHRYLPTFCSTFTSLRKNLPWLSLPSDVEEHFLRYAHRVPMREGAVLIWDQRLLHGTAPNHSSNCRMAQYMKVGSRHLTFPSSNTTESPDMGNARLTRRALMLSDQLMKSQAMDAVDELGRRVFALDILDSP